MDAAAAATVGWASAAWAMTLGRGGYGYDILWQASAAWALTLAVAAATVGWTLAGWTFAVWALPFAV